MVGVTTALPASLSDVSTVVPPPVMERDSAPVVIHSSTALLPSAMVVGLAVNLLTRPVLVPVPETVTVTLLVTDLPEPLAVRV